MSTESQIQANRANSEKSTGPNTSAGKAASSQNRRSHGLSLDANFILAPSEDPVEFQALINAFNREHEPATPTELLFIEKMAQHHWLRNRALRNQQDAMNEEGQITDRPLFSLYMRYEMAHERAFHKCLSDLLKLRSERQKLQIGFEREKRQQGAYALDLLTKKAVAEHKFFQAHKEFPGVAQEHLPRVTYFCAQVDAVYDQFKSLGGREAA